MSVVTKKKVAIINSQEVRNCATQAHFKYNFILQFLSGIVLLVFRERLVLNFAVKKLSKTAQ